MSDRKNTKGGDPIIRHGKRDDYNFVLPVNANEEQMVSIENHIEKYIGKIDNVYHELMSDTVHIDVHVVKPTPERNFYTLVTTGMSDIAMSIPPDLDANEFQYAELMICLPPDWPLEKAKIESESEHDTFWPVQTLKFLARFPHAYETFLTATHSIPNGNPAEPVAGNVDFTGFIIGYQVLADEKFNELKISDDKLVNFYALYPVYDQEMNLKLKKGFDKLWDLFVQNNVTELLDINRTNVAANIKPWWKLF